MTTLSEILNKLRADGYTEDFNLNPDSITSKTNKLQLHPNDFVIDKHYRFEGESNPDDEAVVYAISSVKGDIKGVLVDGYGTSSDDATEDMVKKLKERKDL